ncbi:DUF1674 domain-containing protein [Suttonella sp. R2A3]|uniref:DUF1674 domain-containing protein n=1 Tax=Suttonella sp. R2A3 TaxID=2908648 RepID=UPI0038FC235E
MSEPSKNAAQDAPKTATEAEVENSQSSNNKKETGGPKGLEPTRYGDWERNGRCVDF